MLKKLIFSVPVAVIYYILVYNIINSMYESLAYNEKKQKTITLIFVVSLLTLISSYFLMNNEKTSSIKIGLAGGGGLLMFNSVVKNWDNLENQTKVTILGIMFGFVSWVAYYANKNNKQKELYDELDDDDDNNNSDTIDDTN
jgi:hypothetical protein